MEVLEWMNFYLHKHLAINVCTFHAKIINQYSLVTQSGIMVNVANTTLCH